jgi:hypothetical protein
MANMRAVAMAAPSSSVQATAWPSGICWSSGLAGGSLPLIRLQPTRITFWAASTAISPAASFSARTERPSPFFAIGSPRPAAKHRAICGVFTRNHLTAQPKNRSRCQAAADPALPRHQRRARRRGSRWRALGRKLAPPPPRQHGNNNQGRQPWRFRLRWRLVLAGYLARRRLRLALPPGTRHQQGGHVPSGDHACSGHSRTE